MDRDAKTSRCSSKPLLVKEPVPSEVAVSSEDEDSSDTASFYSVDVNEEQE